MVLDKITETIAHFAGLFDIAIEEGRMRESHRKFDQMVEQQEEVPSLDPRGVAIRSPHEFDGFDPYIPYAPAPPLLEPRWTALDLIDRRLDAELAAPDFWQLLSGPRFSPAPDVEFDSSTLRLPKLQPPGSVAVVVEQVAVMSDDDALSFGGHGRTFEAVLDPDAALEALAARAEALSLSPDFELPGTPQAIKDFIVSLRDTLDAYEADGPADAGITVVKDSTLDGVFVNGTRVEAAPSFAQYRPQDGAEDEGSPFGEGWQPSLPDRPLGRTLQESLNDAGASEADDGPHAAVELQAGGNTLVNAVTLNSSWLAATVTAIVGDHVELNAIVQLNVWSDIDHVTGAIGVSAEEAATLGFNIASFDRIDPQADDSDTAASDTFPSFWVVTQVTGDLLILNWIEQITFMTDNDLAILSASGSKAEIVTGENGARNAVSLAELGHAYDLIVVGGSVYDASIIYQMNLLLDDDLVGAVSGFGAGGGSSVVGGGNLLWNEAGIVNVGGADRFEPLTQPYRDAASQLAAGDRSASAGVLADPAFAGSGALKVLYITGDIINLNFVKQTNVLGDGDQVALAMDAAQAAPDAQWTVSTGANTLVNFAQIADVDALGKTYVGGEVYSDEILIQAELVSDAPALDLGGRSADQLVNEAVAFLGDDDSGPHDAPIHPIAPPADLSSADPMQTMLA